MSPVQSSVNRRRNSATDSGLELLAAMAFLSVDGNAEAIRLALQATGPTTPRERRGLAAIIHGIATSRLGNSTGGLGKAEIDDFARRHSAHGLMRYPIGP